MKEQESPHRESISLNKFISRTGRCSRREADRLIEAGRVTINGRLARKGNRVQSGDDVAIDGDSINALVTKPIYIAFNKPVGIVCTTDSQERANIVDFIGHEERLFPIGRLDKDSQGLIFLTNDGDIVNRILRVDNQHEKEYMVQVKQAITPTFIRRMSEGVVIMGKTTRKCQVTQVNKHTFSIILQQGWNRQIRRMCEALDYQVVFLQRTRIMHVTLGKLKQGKWRNLNTREIEQLQQLLEKSSAQPRRQRRSPSHSKRRSSRDANVEKPFKPTLRSTRRTRRKKK